MLFSPATYFHDVNEEKYRAGSTFLAIINNENTINYEYIKNLKSLKKLVLVMYEDDVAIVPKESSWFGFWNRELKPIPLEQLELYRQDKLGLKSMRESGKLIFLTSPLGHLELNETWFINKIIPLLKEE
jgi:palmitoyl-protein thioesterase